MGNLIRAGVDVPGSIAFEEAGMDALPGGGHPLLGLSNLFKLIFVSPAGRADPVRGKL